MSRYYFDMRHEDEIASDEEGLELPTIESVQEEAPARSRTWRGSPCGLIATGQGVLWQSKSGMTTGRSSRPGLRSKSKGKGTSYPWSARYSKRRPEGGLYGLSIALTPAANVGRKG
jgi:hypothetical protein